MSSPGEVPRQTIADELEEEVRLFIARLHEDLPPGPPDPMYVGPNLRERTPSESRRLAALGKKMVDEFAAQHPELTPPSSGI